MNSFNDNKCYCVLSYKGGRGEIIEERVIVDEDGSDRFVCFRYRPDPGLH